MAPETQPGTAPAVEAERSFSYKPIYAREREECLQEDPFRGYTRTKRIGSVLEVNFRNYAKRLVPYPGDNVTLLWKQRTGETWVSKGIFMPGIFQGYRQQEAGFARYEASHLSPLGRDAFKEVKSDSHRQDYECKLVTHFDELSEPIPTDNPDYDPVAGEAVLEMIRSWMRHPDSPNGFGGNLDNGDWIRASAKDFGVLIPEYGDQAWAALSIGGGDRELQAARIGHNARVYRQGFGLLRRTGHHGDGLAKNDQEVILVPVEISVG